MKNRTLSALLLSKTSPLQLWIALIGSGIGLLILMLGMQLWIDVRSLMQEKELLRGDYLVISKKVNLLHTLGGAPTFDQGEIAALNDLKSVDDVGAFLPSKFKASMELSASIAGFSGQLMKTDLFFEAVPNRFLDVSTQEWQWKPGMKTVPVVVPAEFIKQYNHGFASGQNMPVIPENMLKSIQFYLEVSGNGKTAQFRGSIAGFSNRIQAILVPNSFMEYANTTFADGAAPRPGRLILHADNPASPELLQFLQSKDYELNQEKMKAGQSQLLLELLLMLVVTLGLFIIGLAMLGFLQYNQLLAYRSAYEIQTLHWLGFSLQKIIRPYQLFILRNLGISLTIACLLFALLQWLIDRAFSNSGFELPHMGWPGALLSGLITTLVMLWLGNRSIKKQVGRLAN